MFDVFVTVLQLKEVLCTLVKELNTSLELLDWMHLNTTDKHHIADPTSSQRILDERLHAHRLVTPAAGESTVKPCFCCDMLFTVDKSAAVYIVIIIVSFLSPNQHLHLQFVFSVCVLDSVLY